MAPVGILRERELTGKYSSKAPNKMVSIRTRPDVRTLCRRKAQLRANNGGVYRSHRVSNVRNRGISTQTHNFIQFICLKSPDLLTLFDFIKLRLKCLKVLLMALNLVELTFSVIFSGFLVTAG